MVLGIAAIVAALLFFFTGMINFYKGAAIPFLLIGLLLTVVGYTVFTRSDDDRERNVYACNMNPSALKEKELPRRRSVMKILSFTVIQ